MGEHLVLYVDRLVVPTNTPEAELAGLQPSSRGSSSVPLDEERGKRNRVVKEEEESPESGDEEDSARESQPLIDGAECRICQEEDTLSNLEAPCACSGSLKYAHRKCVQHWCNEKGDIICEICRQTYQPGYAAPPLPSPHSEEAAIDIGAAWAITGAHIDFQNPRLLAIAQVEQPFFEADYDDYAASGARAATFCRSAILIMMALLFMRHAWVVSDTDDDDDLAAFFSPCMVRAAGFLLPCYIVAWVFSMLQRRRLPQIYCSLGIYLKK